MKIKGIQGLSVSELQEEISRGGRFVRFRYCFSLLVLTIGRRTDVYFLRPEENAFLKSWPWTLTTFLFGWWGLPWGVFSSVGCLTTNMRGGSNMTEEVMDLLYRKNKGPIFDFEKDPSP